MDFDETNKRKHTRLRLSFDSEFVTSDKRILAGRTRDVSFGGAYLYCRNATESMIGAGGRLRIILQPGVNGTVELAGRIVRTDMEGIGIEFISIGADDYRKFRDLMLYNSPDPDILLDELKKHPGIDRSQS